MLIVGLSFPEFNIMWKRYYYERKVRKFAVFLILCRSMKFDANFVLNHRYMNSMYLASIVFLLGLLHPILFVYIITYSTIYTD